MSARGFWERDISGLAKRVFHPRRPGLWRAAAELARCLLFEGDPTTLAGRNRRVHGRGLRRFGGRAGDVICNAGLPTALGSNVQPGRRVGTWRGLGLDMAHMYRAWRWLVCVHGQTLAACARQVGCRTGVVAPGVWHPRHAHEQDCTGNLGDCRAHCLIGYSAPEGSICIGRSRCSADGDTAHRRQPPAF